MPILPSNRFLVCAVVITTLLACGGATESGDRTAGGEAGSTERATGGSNVGKGGATSDGGVIGKGGAIVANGGCCGAETPNCQEGYTEIVSLSACPAGATCYTQAAWCCDRPRYCASAVIGTGGSSAGGAIGFGATGNVGTAATGNVGQGATGNVGTAATGNVGATTATGGLNAGGSAATGNVGAATASGGSSAGGAGTTTNTGGSCGEPPVCDAGDVESTEACSLSGTTACYTHWKYQCAPKIAYVTCLKPSVPCDRAADYNRSYHQADSVRCLDYDVLCAPQVRFDNACGCGCEQPASCPRWVDCMPGPTTLDPLCTDSTSCPFTIRAM